MRSDQTAGTHFLNVDLEVESDHDISKLVSARGRTVFVVHQTDAFVSFETSMQYDTIQSCLDAFIRAIDGLPPQAQTIWDGCARRTANVGIQAGSQPYSAHFPIAHQTLAALAAIGCGLELTIYAAPAPLNGASAAASS